MTLKHTYHKVELFLRNPICSEQDNGNNIWSQIEEIDIDNYNPETHNFVHRNVITWITKASVE